MTGGTAEPAAFTLRALHISRANKRAWRAEPSSRSADFCWAARSRSSSRPPNVYLGLKVGLTLRILDSGGGHLDGGARAFRNATIYENNIVQTVASAAGTLSSVIFVLPGLVMIGWWTGFPFSESFSICSVGGVLGVMYSAAATPRAGDAPTCPTPGLPSGGCSRSRTGTGSTAERRPRGIARRSLAGTIASAGFAVVVATRIFAGEIPGYFRAGAAQTSVRVSRSRRARRRRATHRRHRRQRHPGRAHHCVWCRDAAARPRCIRSRGCRRRRDGRVGASGAIHRRGRNWRGRALVARTSCAAGRARGCRRPRRVAQTTRKRGRSPAHGAGSADRHRRCRQRALSDLRSH